MDSKRVLYDLPSPRLVRTVHSDNDLSVFIHDDAVPMFRPFGPEQMGFATFDRRDDVPVNNSHASPSISDDLPRCPPAGITFCTTDFVPGTQTPMHRTLIMNSCVAMSREIVLAFDSGEEKLIREGDITVQQGVNHM
ncbi:hypothetical protein Focb16_v006347 [Fusarium oxysporum f. sp. cubense]|uniref:Uncharacterized protein n=1 Tax=Fusarium oxysporum f. sp. cubense TaxID=61366 RepID=A0A559LPY2_FUSOC|nr:hypothetical protein Focb16_v006347 [Fusarium oxysporum f. sp. cubense]